ncbi:hypothetical protein H072_10041 [Dactylellina haptotyla CBS 200.50]|uniref:Uncharacterized protein n=1 Tax=Dactylellina haptotyla (strain CBS 200.50) TaxID=1284197 RepID=S8BBE1_DACHA|nr:hypothetical protein H072_10041 [Dactylellina haptotyla CBS 200.50]
MATALHTSPQGEQRLLSHLNSFEQYQIQKSRSFTTENVPRSRMSDQNLIFDLDAHLDNYDPYLEPEIFRDESHETLPDRPGLKRRRSGLSRTSDYTSSTRSTPGKSRHQVSVPHGAPNSRNLRLTRNNTPENSRVLPQEQPTPTRRRNRSLPSQVRARISTILLDSETEEQPSPRSLPRSILRSSLDSQNARNRNRVSFASQDHLLEFKNDQINPIKEARHKWVTRRRTSLAAQELEEEGQTEEEAMESASAYGPGYSATSLRSSKSTPRVSGESSRARERYPSEPYPYPRPFRQNASGARYPREQDRRDSTRAFGDPLKLRQGSGLQTSHPGAPPSRSHENRHRHIHGYQSCEHEFLDPMDCSCDTPDKRVEVEGECKDCAAEKAELEDKKPGKGDETGTNSTWWRKLGKKIIL